MLQGVSTQHGKPLVTYTHCSDARHNSRALIGATWEKVNVLSRAVGNNCHSPKNNPDMNKNMLYKLMNLLYVRRIFPVLLFFHRQEVLHGFSDKAHNNPSNHDA